MFAALAHAARRHVLLVVWFRGGSMSAGDIAGRFHHSWPTTSRHLGVLVEAGLLVQERQGRTRSYRVNQDRLDVVRGWLRWFDAKPGEREEVVMTKPAEKRDVAAKPTDEHIERGAAALRAVAAGFPGAYEEYPWGEVAAKVKGKAFMFMHAGAELSMSCKLPHSHEMALMLPFARATGYGLGKSGWVTSKFGPGEELPIELLRQWLEESYRAIAPKRLLVGGGGEGAAKKVAKPGGAKKVAAKKVAKPGGAKKVAKVVAGKAGVTKKATKVAKKGGARS